MPICIHCDLYDQVPESLRTVIVTSTNKKIYRRYCRRVEKEVRGEDLSCQYFIPHKYFWCEQLSSRLHLIQCLNRQRQKMEDCKGCSQADDILDVARGRDLYEYFGVNRRIHQNKIKEKPKLRRRKA